MAGVADFAAQHRRIGIDTSIFVYHFEDVVEFRGASDTVLEGIAVGAVYGVTSILTLVELTVKPLALGQRHLADQYTAILLRFPNLAVEDVDLDIAQTAARLRSRHGVRTIDAVQIATALTAGATGFVTNDRRLRSVSEIDVLVLADTDEAQRRG